MEVSGSTKDISDVPVPEPLDIVRARLAELVVHLTDCAPDAAIDAIRHAAPVSVPSDHEGRLALVAAALVRVRLRIDLRERAPVASTRC